MVYLPDFSYYYNKERDTKLHYAAYKGQLNRVKQMVEERHINVYKQGNDGRTAIYNAIIANRKEIIEYLLDIYERDTKALQDYLTTLHQNFDHVNATNSILIAYGEEECNRVVKIENEVKYFDDGTDDGIIIMCKQNNLDQPKFYWMKPKTREHTVLVLNLISEIYPNGSPDFNVSGICYQTNSLIAVAHFGHKHIFKRLIGLGNKMEKNDSSDILEIIFQNGHLELFNEHFLSESFDYLNQKNPRLLGVLAVDEKNFEFFKFYMEKLIIARMEKYSESRQTAIDSILTTEDDGWNSTPIEYATTVHSKLGCAALIMEHFEFDIRKILKPKDSLICKWINIGDDGVALVMQLIEKYPEIVNGTVSYASYNVMHQLIANNYIEEFKHICDRNPSAIHSFLDNVEAVGHILSSAIINSRSNVVLYFLENYKKEMNNKLILYRISSSLATIDSDVARDMLKKVLEFSEVDPYFMIDENHFCPLIQTLFSNLAANFRVFLESGKVNNVNVKSQFGDPLISLAIQRPVYKPSLNAVGMCPTGYTSHWADVDSSDDEDCQNDNGKVENNRINQSTDKEEIDENARAAMNELFMKLIEMGADPFVLRDYDSKSLLHIAVDNSNLEIIKVLIEKGLSVTQETKSGKQAIHYVKMLPILDYFIETFGEDIVKTKDRRGATLLTNYMRKCDRMCPEFLKKLLDLGCSANECVLEGSPPLFFVTNSASAQVLIDYGADINYVNSLHETPLFAHLHRCNNDVALFLLQQTNLDLRAIHNGRSLVHYICDIAPETLDKFKPILEARQDDFTYIVSKTCNTPNIYGSPIIFRLICNNRYVAEKLLAEESLKAKQETENMYWDFSELYTRYIDLFELLLKKGYNVNYIDKQGYSALLNACKGRCYEIIEILIKEGADIHQISNLRESALYCIAVTLNCSRGFIEGIVDSLKIIALLLKHNADIKSKDDRNLTAMEIVDAPGLSKIIQRLIVF